MPSSTDARIEEIVAKIRKLCCEPFNQKAELELRKLARELRIAIRHHVQMATSSLAVKGATIFSHDPEAQRR